MSINIQGARLLTDREKRALEQTIQSRTAEVVQVKFFDYRPTGIELDFADPRRPHTYVGASYNDQTHWTQASFLVDFPGMLRVFLSSLAQILGVSIVEPPPPKPEAEPSPVGEYWPELSERLALEAYRVAPGANIWLGRVWEYDGNLFVAQKSRAGFFEFWFWQKVA